MPITDTKVYQEQVLESVNYIERTSLIKMHFSKFFQNIKLANRRGHYGHKLQYNLGFAQEKRYL